MHTVGVHTRGIDAKSNCLDQLKNKLRTAESRRCSSVGLKNFGKPWRGYHKKDVENFLSQSITAPKNNKEGALLDFLRISGVSEIFLCCPFVGLEFFCEQKRGVSQKIRAAEKIRHGSF